MFGAPDAVFRGDASTRLLGARQPVARGLADGPAGSITAADACGPCQ